MTVAKVELGRHLFYDTRLSVNGKQSCASCHEQARAFTDGKARAIGTTGETHPRSSMSIVNIAYTPVLTWANPNMKQLERQALVPMFGEHPVELGLSGKETEVLARLKAEPRYQKFFPEVFGNAADPFTIENITKAIAAFERVLISGDSPYDRYLNGQRNAVSASVKRGETLFFGERLECFHCHGGFNFSQTTDHVGKAFVEIEFHNTGLYNLDGKGAFPKDNPGTFDITQRPEDVGKFRAPTLRNIAVTAPYMHDGSIATLEGVIDHYAAGGRTIRSGEFKGVGSANPNKSAFVKGFKLTPREKRDVIVFLRSLTDEKFLADARFGDPWKSQLSEQGRSQRGADQPLKFDPLPNPARPGGFMPNLTVTPDQRLLLSWVEPGDGQALALRYAIAQGGLWSEVRTVASRQAIVRYQSARPAVTLLPDGNLIACWEQNRQGSKPSSQPIDVVFSTSRDGGKTWSDPRPIHRDRSESSHDFVSATPTGRDEIAAVWLDGREMKKSGRQMLMTATIKTDGSVSEEKMLDPDVCSCCPTTVVNTPDGLLVAYRDHEAGEIRDISLLHFTAGQWSAPRKLHRDSWRINGCPTNGVTLDADGKRVAVTWFTAANDKPTVKAAFSADDGKTFGQPLIVSQGKAIGRTAITLLADGSAAIAWVENVAGSSQVMVSRIGSGGEISAPTMLGKTGKSFPRIARAGRQVVVAWTDPAGAVKTVVMNGHVENQPVGISMMALPNQRP